MSAQEFETFLEANVAPAKREAALQHFRHVRGPLNKEFLFYGSDWAEWGMATLLNQERMPKQQFTDSMGFDSDSLPPDNRVRIFMDGFERFVGAQCFIRPCF